MAAVDAVPGERRSALEEPTRPIGGRWVGYWTPTMPGAIAGAALLGLGYGAYITLYLLVLVVGLIAAVTVRPIKSVS